MKNIPLFLVELNVVNLGQATDQAKIILENGADGVILTNKDEHIFSTDDEPNLFDIAQIIKVQYPDCKVGINPLDMTTLQALRMFSKTELDIFCADDGHVRQSVNEAHLSEEYIEILAMIKETSGKKFRKKIFAGITCGNEQRLPDNVGLVARTASEHFQAVIVPSKRNESPTIEMIQMVRKAITQQGNICVANGITVENVTRYVMYSDVLIVGSGVNINAGSGTDAFCYDGNKVAEICEKIHTYVI